MSLPFIDFELLLNSGIAPTFASPLYMWGDNTYGQLGDFREVNYFSWSQIRAGGQHTLALRSDGTLYTWGRNNVGQLGDSTTVDKNIPTYIAPTSLYWKSISAGESHSVAIDDLNSVYIWGNNKYGQLGLNDTLNRSAPTQIASFATTTVDASAGGNHTGLIATSNNILYTAGFNQFGQLGDNTLVDKSVFTQIGTSSWQAISAGKNHTLALTTDSTMFAWGDNTYGQAGLNESVVITRSSPVQVGASSWSQVSAGGSHTSALDINQFLYTFGYDYYGQLGLNRSNSVPTITYAQISQGTSHTLAIDLLGKLYAYGLNNVGQLGDGTTITRSSPVQIGTSSWSQVFAGSSYSTAITSDGKLYLWGLNSKYQLGLSDTINRSSPVQVSGDGSYVSVGAGESHTLALRSDYSLWGWGDNALTQLGTATILGSSWTKIVTGDQHSLAIRNDGTLWTWGLNSSGQLGTGLTTNRSSPVQIGTSIYTDVTAGLSHSLAIRNDGSLWGWGLNSSSQLFSYSWTQIATGQSHSLLLRSDGNLWSFGLGSTGQLGNSSTLNRSSPVQVSATSSYSFVAAGNNVSAGIDPNGLIYLWGLNSLGQLGINDTLNRSAPVQVGIGYGSWSQISLADSTLALTTEGAMFTWGLNSSGQLGVSSTTNRKVPQLIGGVSDNSAYSMGFYTDSVAVSSATVAVGTSNFTVEFWFYGTNVNATQALYDVRNPNTSDIGFDIYISQTGPTLNFGTASINYIVGGTTLVNNTWYHVALSRSGATTYQLFLNGVQEGSTYTTSQNFTNSIVTVGGGVNGSFKGYISNVRLVKNQGLYTGTFTPSTSPLTTSTVGATGAGAASTLTGTVILLLCKSATIVDNSNTPLTVTSTGSPSPSLTNPFDVISYTQTTSWSQVSAGGTHSLAIADGGDLYAWGSNATGQLGINSTLSRSSPVQVSTSSWQFISASYTGHNLGTINNLLFVWGLNSSNELGLGTSLYAGDTVNRSLPVQLGTSSYSVIATGNSYSTAIDINKTLYVWGNNNAGQLGIVTPLSWTVLNRGNLHADNTLWLWGLNSSGQLGTNDTITRSSPVQVNGSWTSIVRSRFNTYAINSVGQLYAVGSNSTGQLGQGDTVSRSRLTQIGSGSWTSVTANGQSTEGFDFALATQSDGTLYAWGYNGNFNLGDGTWTNKTTPSQIDPSTNLYTRLRVVFATSGDQLSLSPNAAFAFGTGDFTIECWFNPTSDSGVFFDVRSGFSGINPLFYYYQGTLRYYVNGADRIVSTTKLLGGNWYHAAIVRSSGVSKLYLNGVQQGSSYTDTFNFTSTNYVFIGKGNANDNPFTGSISNLRVVKGTGVYTSNFTPPLTLTNISGTSLLTCQSATIVDNSSNNFTITVNGPTVSGSTSTSSWTVVSAGVNHATAITSSGALWGWGNNTGGIIQAPVSVSTLVLGASSIITTDNVLWMWGGANSTGSLGDGTTVSRSSPVQLGGGWKYIARQNGQDSPQAALGIKTDGTLWFWGKGTGGLSGNDDEITRSSPVQIGDDLNWDKCWVGGTSIQTGPWGLALKVDGTLWGWGYNFYGNLGTNDTNSYSVPTQIGSDTWTAISVNDFNAYGIKSDGTLWAWGNNQSGSLGLLTSDAVRYSSPAQIGTSSWTVVSAGSTSAGAIRQDGTLWTWGQNLNGEIGVGDRVNRSSPTQIAGGGTWTKLLMQSFAGGGIATKSGGTLWGWYAGSITNTPAFTSSPVQIGTSSWTTLATSTIGGLAGLINRVMYGWGVNNFGQLGTSSSVTPQSSPVVVTSFSNPVSLYASPVQVGNSSWISVSAGESNTAALRTGDRATFTWGLNNVGQLGLNDTVSRSSPVQVGTSSWSQVSVGSSWMVGLTTGGTLFTWGLNSSGQLGIALTTNRSSPVQVGALATWNQTGVMWPSSAMGTLTDGSAYVWGSNTSSALGLNDTVNRSSPVQLGSTMYTIINYPVVYGTSSYSLVSAGSSTTVFKNSVDGYLYASGFGGTGQLGTNNNTVSRSTPVQILTSLITPGNFSSPVQIGSSSYSMVSAGNSHTTALTTDYKLKLWGDNTYGQLGDDTSVVTSETRTFAGSWTSVDAGNDFNLAIDTNQNVYSWGRNTSGQIGTNDTLNRSSPVQVSGTYKGISAGANTSYAINNNNSSLYAWGDNSLGQLGINDTVNRSSPIQVSTISWSTINAGSSHIAAMTSTNLVYAWGDNAYGQLGKSDTLVRSSVVQLGSASFNSVLGKSRYGVNVLGLGAGIIIGRNSAGQVGDLSTINRSSPVMIAGTSSTTITLPTRIGINSWNQVAAGYSHSVGILSDSTLYAWGSGVTGRLGIGVTTNRSSPVQVSSSSWSMISASKDTSAAIRIDGSAFTWGLNTSGQLGDNTIVSKSSPVVVAGYWNDIIVGESNTVAIKENNTVFIWGYNFYGNLGQSDTVNRSSPVQIGNNRFSNVMVGANNTTLLDPYGSLYTLGDARNGDLGLTQPIYYNWSQLSAGSHTMAIRSDGTLWAWGLNTSGQLGDGTTVNKSIPVFIPGSWNYVSAGLTHTVAVRNDGTLWTWGLNSLGQLGDNTSISRSSPVQIYSVDSGATTWSVASAGALNSYAIKTDNTLWAFGSNYLNAAPRTKWGSLSTPVQISGSWTSVSGGLSYTTAIDTTGALYAWGANVTSGQLGITTSYSWVSIRGVLGSTTSTYFAIDNSGLLYSWGSGLNGQMGYSVSAVNSSPLLIDTGISWTEIGGTYNTTAFNSIYGISLASSAMYAWGDNTNGILGVNSTTNATYSSPVQISNVGSGVWSKVTSHGLSFTAGLTTTGELYAWGLNSVGQLGLGNTVLRSAPTQITSPSASWAQVYASVSVLHAITTDGDLYATGAGPLLGDNTTVNKSTLTFIASSVSTVSSGDANGILMLKTDGTLYAWGTNAGGQLGLNDTISRSSPTQIPSFIGSSVTLIRASISGQRHAVLSNNTLWAWGLNTAGQLGDFTTVARSSPTQISSLLQYEYPTALFDATSNTVIVTNKNNIWQMGANAIPTVPFSITGIGRSYPMQIPSITTMAESPTKIDNNSWSLVESGVSHAVALRSDSLLFGWGLGSSGQLAITQSYNAINAGGMLILADGELWTWGLNTSTQLGDNTNVSKSSPVMLANIFNYSSMYSWTSVASGADAKYAILNDYTLWGWGNNTSGQLGNNTSISRSFPTQLVSGSYTQISAGNSNLYAIDTLGRLFSAGSNQNYQLGISSGNTVTRSSPTQVASGSSFALVAAGNNFAIAKLNDGTLWGWGDNTYGQLGVNGSLISWVQVASSSHAVAIRSDGTVWSWGSNTVGQLGLTDTVNRSSPVQIVSLSGSITQVFVGLSQSYAIASDGSLYAWGNNANAQLATNDTLNRSNPTQIPGSWSFISARYQHALAIRSDGTLYAWGSNTYGELGQDYYGTSRSPTSSPVQVGTSSYVNVTTGIFSSLGITTDNKLFGWGQNTVGQLGLSGLYSWNIVGGGSVGIGSGKLFIWGNQVTSNGFAFEVGVNRSSPVQLGSSSWTLVSGNNSHTVAVRSDNTIWGWGLNTNGQLGTNDTLNRSSPTQISSTSDWSQVRVGDSFTIALKSDNTLWAWGLNTSGQLGTGDFLTYSSPVQIGTSSWLQISSGGKHNLGITINNKLYAWGLNNVGQTANNGSVVSWTFVTAAKGIPTNTTIGSYAIRSDGKLFSWGANNLGQLGINTVANRSSPVQVGNNSWITLTAGESNNILAIRSDNTLWSWGYNVGGSLGLGDTLNRSSPTQVGNSSWSVVKAGASFAAAITIDGQLYMWGVNAYGVLGDSTPTAVGSQRSSPVQVGVGNSWTNIAMGSLHTIAIHKDGTLYSWGINNAGQLGSNTTSTGRSSPVQVNTSSWSQVEATGSVSYGITSGKLYGWGLNTGGWMGVNDTLNRSSPTQIFSGSSFTQVSIGYKGAEIGIFGITTGGTLFAWGQNTTGLLGINSSTSRSSPIQIGALTNWSKTGGAFAINSSGNLYGWGNNADGTIGTTDTVNRSSPVQIGTTVQTLISAPLIIGNSSWSQIGAGDSHSVAIGSTGLLYAWGLNSSGQLATTSDTVNRSSPVQIGASTWTSVASGGSHSAAIRSDGSVFTWGAGASGQLGNTSSVNRSSPVQISLNSWSSIGSNNASSYMFGTLITGQLYAWGNNAQGQLGDGTTVTRSSPVLIGTALPGYIITPQSVGTDSWNQLTSGFAFALGIKSDETLWAWGQNANGQLGLNDTLNRSSPTQITSVTGASWTSVGAHAYTGLALRDTGAIYAWGNNAQGQLGDNTTVTRSVPVQIVGGRSFSILSASVGDTAAGISDNNLWMWGLAAQGNIGNNTTNIGRSSITQVGTSRNVFEVNPVQISSDSWTLVASNYNSQHVLGIRNNLVYAWGRNSTGQLGLTDTINRSSPVQISSLVGNYSLVDVGGSASIALKTDKTGLFAWGDNQYGQLVLNDTINRSSPVQITNVNTLYDTASMGDGTILAIDNSTKILYASGLGTSGQLGDNTIVSKSNWTLVTSTNLSSFNTPMQIGTNSWNHVGAGNNFTFGLDVNNYLYEWGINASGSLGTNDTLSRSSPVQVTSSSYTEVSAGGAHILGYVRDNVTQLDTLYAWGFNTQGQLGDGTVVTRSSPVIVASYTLLNSKSSPVQINSSGFGNFYRSSPSQVGTKNWRYVSSGDNHTVATQGVTLFTWGRNTEGELGDLTTINRSSPIQIGSANDTLAINAGNNYTMTISIYGVGLGVGDNSYGKLGDNT